MALYKVTRNDSVGPGEFVQAIVIASGTAQARNAVGHLAGVTKKNVTAEPMETRKHVEILSTYFDESPTLLDAASEVDAVPDYTI